MTITITPDARGWIATADMLPGWRLEMGRNASEHEAANYAMARAYQERARRLLDAVKEV
jgi:hypothetical protein